ncbi:MAG: hypothetical protein ACI85I_001827 [Arenicella sp.]|jgi:hypothetical protein
MKLYKTSIAFLLCSFVLFSCASDGGEGTEGETDNGGSNKIVSENTKPMDLSEDFPTMFSSAFIGKSKEQVLANIDKMIDKEIGAYLIYKPGVAAIQKRVTSAEDLKSTFAYIDETLVQFKEAPKKGELPYFDCETFDKEGNFYKEVEKGGRVQMAMNDEKNLLYTDFPEEEVTKMVNADNATSVVMVSTNAQVEMGFGKVNGKWRIITVNIADFDCGA